MAGISYFSLVHQLNRRAQRAVLSQLGFQNRALNEHLQQIWAQSAGVHGSFISDPVFECTFGYEPADVQMSALSGGLLNKKLVGALDKPPAEFRAEYSFGKSWCPYAHQLEAWQTLLGDEPKSVLVSSGTGSGKTECFLVPILNDLANQCEAQSVPLEGVQALFLYPLNALIESQRERLSAWSRAFKGDIRYCLYNGNTPTSPPPSAAQRQSPEQVLSRAALRSSPPPILVTNSTMLEYMLVRQDDQPILEKSKGKLKWVVLDEAHTYMGSNAAEIAMLLRRVMHSFDVIPEDVRFIATSATIGSGDDEILAQLRTFLADVAGIQESQVTVITGDRKIPRITTQIESGREALSDLRNLADLPDADRWRQVSKSRVFRSLRDYLTGGEIPQKTLTQVVDHLAGLEFVCTREKALELLDLCAGTRDESGTAFLPTRLHLFEKTLNGIWACVNENCAGRKDTSLDSSMWKFGKLFMHQQAQCDCCGMPVYEVLSCTDCGAEYLSAQEVPRGHAYFLEAYRPDDDIDEFQLDLDLDDDDENKTVPLEEHRRLVSAYGEDRKDWIGPDRKISDRRESPDQVELSLISPREGKLWCACCGTKDTSGFSKLRFKKLGAPFFLGDILPTVLEHCPRAEGSERNNPAEGRRLLTFTDSRQGTARIAARLQQDSDRNFVRSLLYHLLHPVTNNNVADVPADLARQLADLERGLEASLPATVKETLQSRYDELLRLKEGAGAGRAEIPSMTWSDAAKGLAHNREIREWMRDDLNRLSGAALSEEDFAKFCLYREFARRPKRGNQSETLGLIKLVYPRLDQITKTPDQWIRWGGSVDDWRDFLYIFVDHHIRENSCVAVDPKFTQWMGAKIRVKYLQGPHKERIPGLSRVIYWPELTDRDGRVPRMAGLLLAGFQLDRHSQEDTRAINLVLQQAWVAIIPMLYSVGDGFLLDFEKSVELSGLTEAWVCPFTRRLLPRAFRGLSPYTQIMDGNQTPDLCTRVELPVYPHRFWRDEVGRDLSPQEIRNWIDSDKTIESLRKQWVWPNRSDRAAEGEIWIAVGEHSAQQSKPVLDRITNDFKRGRLNILSCSTTMEMGVDIGGISAIAMNNVPPGQANYLQRAGRAGRRKESSSVSVTLCGQSAHSIEVFNNPLWPFDPEGISLPRVALHSRSLVQRHANAFLIAEWLKQFSVDIPKLNCGWFFEDTDGKCRADNFRAWCETLQETSSQLMTALKALVDGTALASSSSSEIAFVCADTVSSIKTDWQREAGELSTKLEVLSAGDEDENRIPIRAVNYQLKALRTEYLLKDLTAKGLLPGHGFPSGIVSLLTTTKEDFDRRRDLDETREDVVSQLAVGPSRDRSIGIREFAPGAEVVVNGVVHQCGGITLNRHIPAGVEGRHEIQEISWHWHCRSCGAGDVSSAMPAACSGCGNDDLERHQTISPNGFAVDIHYERHNDVSSPAYLPFNPPRVNFGGAAWKPLTEPRLGRVRSTEQAKIMHWNAGSNDNAGYAVCFYCGRAAVQINDTLPKVFRKPHKRLRGGKETANETYCPGSDSDWAVKTGLWLIDQSVTSAVELQLKDPLTGESLADDEIAWSVGYGLRHGLARILGVTESEIAVRVQEVKDAGNGKIQSIYLYDAAVSGAGYATQLVDYLEQTVKQALEYFNCPEECDSACNACLIEWDSQHQRSVLDRHKAIRFLSEWKRHLALPEELRVLGARSRVDLKDLSESLRAESYRQKIEKIRFFVGGDADEWDLGNWSMLKEINRWLEKECQVQLLIAADSLGSIPDGQRRILASLIALGGEQFSVGKLKTVNQLNNGGSILATLNGQRPMAWAAASPQLVPGELWSYSDQPLICAEIDLGPLDYDTVSDDELLLCANLSPSSQKIKIESQCDGNTKLFGRRFWEMLGTGYLDQFAGRISCIHYRDRYMCSPINSALLASVVSELSPRISEDAGISVEVMELRESHYQPNGMMDNWNNDAARQSVLQELLQVASGCPRVSIKTFKKRELAHSRELEVEFESGLKLTINLDEGMGCWRQNGYRSFDFAASASDQAKSILAFDGYVGIAHKRIGSWMFISRG
jgi:ATP-dependent helicase YprA (DUF1998 family)